MNKIIIAIDGYSGCGKSTTAKYVAQKLNYIYLDSGAMYRAVTLYFKKNQIDLDNKSAVKDALSKIIIEFVFNPAKGKSDTYLNGENVESEIRKMYISESVSEVSKIHAVREAMVAQQQQLGKAKGIVMDGRDIGTVVFPEAELKVFMLADIVVRAKRRQVELLANGEDVSIDEIVKNFEKRDYIDTTRVESPLKQAEDAILLDSTHITFEEQSEQVIAWANEKMENLLKYQI